MKGFFILDSANIIGHAYTIEFRIYSEELGPEQITIDLGLRPSQTQILGTLGPRGIRKENMWAYDGGEGQKSWERIEDGIGFVLNGLWSHLEMITRYKSNAKLLWWCGHFQSAFDGGPTLSPELLLRLGQFGAPLYIDTYFCEPEESLG